MPTGFHSEGVPPEKTRVQGLRVAGSVEQAPRHDNSHEGLRTLARCVSIQVHSQNPHFVKYHVKSTHNFQNQFVFKMKFQSTPFVTLY